MEKTSIKAATLSKKVKQPRGQPKGKGKAKNNAAVPPATVENLAINFDEVANDFGNMSLEPKIAGGLANMSIDARANNDNNYVAPNQPFFNSDLSSGPYAISTPLVPTCLAQTVDWSVCTATGDNTRQDAIDTGHIHLPNYTYAPHSTLDADRSTNADCLPNTSIAPAWAFDSSLAHNSSLHPPPIPNSLRPPPIPYGSHPSSVYSNSFSQSAAPNLDSPPPSTNSCVCDLTSNTALHHSSCDTALGSMYLPDTSCVEMVRPVIVDLGSHPSFAQNSSCTQTNSPALLCSCAPASIVALLGNTCAGAYTQAAKESNHPLAAFDKGELSDTPSATASNKPVVLDIKTTSTTTAPKKALKKNGRKKIQSILPDKELPEEQPKAGTTRGRGRGHGHACGHSEDCRHVEDPGLDDGHAHDADNGRGRACSRARGGRPCGGSCARQGGCTQNSPTQGEPGVDTK